MRKNGLIQANMDLTKTTCCLSTVSMTFMMPVMMVIMNGISVLIVWVGANGINDGQMQVGDMMAFITVHDADHHGILDALHDLGHAAESGGCSRTCGRSAFKQDDHKRSETAALDPAEGRRRV